MSAEEARNRVGMLCDQLSQWPDLRDIILDAGAGGELDELLTALGAEDEPDQDLMLACVRAIENACARKGLAGITSRDKAFRPLPPGTSPIPGLRAWVCPWGRCDRVVLPEETQAPPVCVVGNGTSMDPFAPPST